MCQHTYRMFLLTSANRQVICTHSITVVMVKVEKIDRNNAQVFPFKDVSDEGHDAMTYIIV